jgi:hypothetical protein
MFLDSNQYVLEKKARNPTREAEWSYMLLFSLPLMDAFELLEMGTGKGKEGRTQE